LYGPEDEINGLLFWNLSMAPAFGVCFVQLLQPDKHRQRLPELPREPFVLC
jgi:hypothetical protein